LAGCGLVPGFPAATKAQYAAAAGKGQPALWKAMRLGHEESTGAF